MEELSVKNEDLDSEIKELRDETALGLLQTEHEELKTNHAEQTEELDANIAELEAVSEARDISERELKELKRDAKKNLEIAVSTEKAKTNEANSELAEVSQKLALQNKRYEVLDSRVADKDSEIFRIQSRMDEMEQSVYGLPEAGKEVKTLTNRVRERDASLKEVQAGLNARERQVRLETMHD